MAVHVDASLPVRPLSVGDVYAMQRAGILAEADRVQLLDGVLVEMSPQGPEHALAIRELVRLAFPVVAAAGLQLSIQAPLQVEDPNCHPEPDLAVVRAPPRGRHPSDAVLVVEMGATSLDIDLGPKAAIYAAVGVPEYWVLDVEGRVLLAHSEPQNGRYTVVSRHDEHASVTAAALPLTVPVGALL